MRAAIYTRVSTSGQAEEGFSLEAQHDALMELLEKKGLQLYRVYSDPGVSGKTFKRPGVQALINDMKAGRFDTLLIHKLDRLSRNLGDLYAFVEMINKLDVRLIIAAQGSEEIDTRSPMGKAFLFFSGIWAQIYLDNLREETLKGLTKKIRKGGKHISRPPMGYTFDDEYNLVIVEDEAKHIRTVYQLYLDGWGVTKIAKHMNDFSTTKEGGKWDNKNVRNVVTNPTYAGFYHFKPDDWPEENRILVEGQHKPIVSREDFEQAQSYRKRRAEHHMSRRYYDYPFGGIVKCHRCGATYTGNIRKSKNYEFRSYRCLNQYAKNTCDAPSISEIKLTELVFEKIMFRDDGIQKTERKKKPKVNIQKEVEKSNTRRKNWMMALGDGKLSSEDYAMLIEEEDKRVKGIYAQIEVEPEESTIPLSELRQMMSELKENWRLIEPATQKKFIQSMFRKIVVHKEKDRWEIIELLPV